ncbi:MAG: integration host factor subunit beta [Thermoguttaceae bacterium]|nr:integration host factor subunit beta [Thermoguttaceae bacterium]
MTKKEISKLVYSDTGLNQTEAQQAVQSTFASLTKLLLKYGRVELRGFGVFEIKTRAERKARNPRTGEEVQVAEHETVVFKPSKLIKNSLEAKRARKAKAGAAKKAGKTAAKAVKKASKKSR